MKIAIISDLHGNLAALEALQAADCDQIWCIGDLVDYGLKPREVIRNMPISAQYQDALIATLRTGIPTKQASTAEGG